MNRGGGRITESEALEQGSEALARGDDGHDVPAAATPGADKHIGEHPFQESRPGTAPRTGRERAHDRLVADADRYLPHACAGHFDRQRGRPLLSKFRGVGPVDPHGS
jgi:hypothetical protein